MKNRIRSIVRLTGSMMALALLLSGCQGGNGTNTATDTSGGSGSEAVTKLPPVTQSATQPDTQPVTEKPETLPPFETDGLPAEFAPDGSPILSKEMDLEIRETFHEAEFESDSLTTVDPLVIKWYYGKFGGMYAVWIDGFPTPDVESWVTIGNYSFFFPYGGGCMIELYSCGSFYSLNYAYENVLLTEDALKALYDSYSSVMEEIIGSSSHD